MRWLWVILLWGLTSHASARQGFLETRDGRTLEGDIVLTNDAFIVISAHVFHVPLGQLARLKFDARAPSPAAAERGRGNGLLGYYFNNTNLTGDVVVRLDQTIDFDWGTAEPARDVNRDFFSVAWMGEVEAPASGLFTLGIATDDRGRLFLNERLLCESWQHQEASETNGTVTLEAGRRYPLRLEYFDFLGNARARLFWSGPDTPRSIIPRGRLFAASFLPAHPASVAATPGLLGTYYRNSNFTGPTFTRVDPTIDLTGSEGVPAPNFSPNSSSVRWSGQVQANVSEVHTFCLASDEPARLWLNDQLLVEQPEASFAEHSDSVPLRQGERYDVFIEARNTGGSLAVKLLWSSPSLPKAVIPATNLFPSRPTVTRNASLEGSIKLPPGIVLRNGSFLAGTVARVTETTVRMSGLLRDTPLSTVNVARIYLQEVSQNVLQHVPAGRRGALLPKGDFIDGDLRRIEDGWLRISSTLFGARRFDARHEVLAVFLQEVVSMPGLYEIRLYDRSVLRVGVVELEPGALTVQDPVLGRLRIPAEELAGIRGR
jgi:hypothetical protein